jgi:hypothetical protein
MSSQTAVAPAPEEVIAQPSMEAKPELPERARPARPLSFHQLAGVEEGGEHPSDISEPQSEAASVEPQVKETALESIKIHAAPQVYAVHAVDPESPIPIRHIAETYEHVVEEPVFFEYPQPITPVEPAPVAKLEETNAPVHETYASPARDPHVPAGTSRWDPIPTLRPTDSGWHRIHDAQGSTAANGSSTANGALTGSSPGSAEQARHTDDWSWTSHAEEEAESQSWEQAEPIEEFDEPLLSRPWGLLSRFQQSQLIAPARKPPSNNTDHNAGQEQGRPESFRNDRRS